MVNSAQIDYIGGNMKRFNLFLIIVILIVSCSKDHDHEETIKCYSPALHIGYQYQLVSNLDESIWVICSIVDTVFRTDGQKVFEIKKEYYSGEINHDYIFHEDSFLVYTELDTIRNSAGTSDSLPGNPFYEQRVAKSNPENGESWENIKGDDEWGKTYMIAVKKDMIDTHLGCLHDVFSYELHFYYGNVHLMTVYYANNMGQVGATLYYNYPELDSSVLSLSYLKINGKEYGKKPDNARVRKMLLNTEKDKFYVDLLRKASGCIYPNP